jgi:hypothetical protein
VRFTAASSHSLSAGTASTWNFLHNGNSSSVFIVARVRSTGDNPDAIHCYLSTGGAASAGIGYYIAYDDTASSSRNNALHTRVANAAAGGSGTYSVVDNTNDKITPGTYHIISSYVDADNATAVNRNADRIDGSAAFGSNVSTNAPSSSNSTYALTLGRDLIATSLDFTGDICEVLIFNTQPDTLDRQKLEGYLAHKWGLTANLPGGHPYKTVGPTPPAPPLDPNFANVSLLLYGNGINGSTSIIDSSPSPKTVTAFGNAQISTAQSKFGGSSIAFDGTGDYLTVPDNDNFALGNGNFTIECWDLQQHHRWI